MSGVAQALNMTRGGGTHATARERKERNAPSFMGHHGHLGYTRQISGRIECSAARPPSPHLAMGRSRSTSQIHLNQDVNTADKDKEGSAALKLGESTAALSTYDESDENINLQHECDDLERLLVRKISAKQPTAATRVSAHRLSECARCTVPSGRDSFGRSTAVPLISTKSRANSSGIGNGSSNSKYAHVRNAHKHVEHPNPYAARVVAQASNLKPGNCRQLAVASAWRSVQDLSGAGRLPSHGAERNQGSSSSSKRAMNLPADRSAGANDLRKRIVRFFAYHDTDKSGECSVAELRSALAPLMEGVPFHVMAALLDRYDANGDGSVTFSEIADRLMLVADQPDDLPLPPAPSNVNGGSKVKCTEAGEERRAASAAVQRRADQLEAAWVHRLGSKMRVDTPSELTRCFRKALQWHDLGNKGVLESAAFTQLLQDAMPTAPSIELKEVLRRYEQSNGRNDGGGSDGSAVGSGVVPIEPAVRRMVALTRSGAGGRQANASWEAAHALNSASLLPPPPPPPPLTISRERTDATSGHDHDGSDEGTELTGATAIKTESAYLARRLLELEDDVVYKLRAKMRNDNPLELRRVLKNLIRVLDNDSDLDLGYHQLLPGLRLLLNSNPNDPTAERELKHLVLRFDADQSGSVNLEELVTRLQQGLVRVNAALKDQRRHPANKGDERQQPLVGRNNSRRRGENQDVEYASTASRRNKRAAQNNASRSTIHQDVDSAETTALFAGPPPEPTAVERACTVDTLEKRLCAMWLSRLPSKAVQGSRAGLLKHVKASLAKFAQQQWHGQVVKVHDDSTIEVALSLPPLPSTDASGSDNSGDTSSGSGSQNQNNQNQNNRSQSNQNPQASSRADERTNNCQGGSSGVVVSLPSVAVTPLGRFETRPRVGRVWVGDESKLAPGAACTFRTATLLAPSEFLAAAREILPPMDDEDLHLLLARYVEGDGKQGPKVVVVSAVAQRLLHSGLAAGGSA